MTELYVIVDGVEYVAEVAEPSCGSWHYHDDPHPDGTPGQPQHHHHDAKCEERGALLLPVHPTRPVFEEAEHDHPGMYRTRPQPGGERVILTPAEVLER